ncbi:DNA polymerase-3 subunit epsilon [Klugiella xanthotipulae]|uniref:DNA polymerase-3 subunit epsilon n=1 Tax=Klugiella xanthotipulae TaxID=244735 RepID=A0A543HXH9_9MICO|nr:DNA polymerase-3 subunit epsilon [Klugiella xanthotipulae]
MCDYGLVPVDFTAIDFETANSHGASACSVGLVRVRDAVVVERASWLIKPAPGHDAFLMWNTKIHGLVAADVADARDWSEQFAELLAFSGEDTMVAHNAGFDMGVIRAACEVAEIPVPPLSYLCSVQVARKTYELASYRLPSAAEAAGFTDFQHHEALADAEACAAIIVDASRHHGSHSLAELAEATGLTLKTLGPTAPKPTPTVQFVQT